jgi:hypothetical protein
VRILSWEVGQIEPIPLTRFIEITSKNSFYLVKSKSPVPFLTEIELKGGSKLNGQTFSLRTAPQPKLIPREMGHQIH